MNLVVTVFKGAENSDFYENKEKKVFHFSSRNFEFNFKHRDKDNLWWEKNPDSKEKIQFCLMNLKSTISADVI